MDVGVNLKGADALCDECSAGYMECLKLLELRHSRTWHKRLPGKASNLVPYAGANLIRFNGIRNFAISAFASRHPDKNMRSLDWSGRQSQAAKNKR